MPANVRLLLGARVEELASDRFTTIDRDWGITAPKEFGPEAGRYVHALGLRPHAAERQVVLSRADLPAEGFRLRIEETGIQVDAPDLAGCFYALGSLQRMLGSKYTGCGRCDDVLPQGVVEAEPRLSFRGAHVPPYFNPLLTADDVVDHIRCCGRNRVNKVVIEYGDMFPWRRHPALRCRRAYRPEDIVRFNEAAREHHVELIPLQSMFGHQRHWLGVDGYRHLAEPPGEGAAPGAWPWQICPHNPDAVRVATELLEEMVESHPESRFVHIGCDEARRFGRCPACRDDIAKDGADAHIVRAIDAFAAAATKLGKRPIVWHDMIVNHVTALDRLRRDAVIMYWDYWTSSMRNPIMTCWWRPEGIPFCAAYDSRWGSEWPVEELDEKARLSLGGTKRYANLDRMMPKVFMDRFGPYLGDEFPKYVRPFFYSAYLRDRGFDVINASACTEKRGGDFFHVFPDPVRGLGNIFASTRSAAKDGLLGAIVTDWYNYPPGYLFTSIMAQGHFGWMPEEDSAERETRI